MEEWHKDQLVVDTKKIMANNYRILSGVQYDHNMKQFLDNKYYWNVFQVDIHKKRDHCPTPESVKYRGVDGHKIVETQLLCITKNQHTAIIRWTKKPDPFVKEDRVVDDLSTKLILLLRSMLTQRDEIFNLTGLIEEAIIPLNVEAIANIISGFEVSADWGRPSPAGLRVNLSYFDVLPNGWIDDLKKKLPTESRLYVEQ